MIYFFFKPLAIKEREVQDIPMLEINSFVMYELTNLGLKTMMLGEKTLKFADRYTVEGIDFTDNSQGYISNMKANNGLYKDNIVYLDGNISYAREDGLKFLTQEMVYDTNSSIATTQSDYLAFRNKNSMRGSSLEYNAIGNTLKSKNVTIKYQLDGEK